jgi:putative FmdB family regulatory protein
MSIYEYRCKSCGHEVDALQKITDPPLKKCPECGRRTLARLMSAPSFRLKGGGWYETDFKSDSEKKRNLVDTGDGAAKEGAAKDGGDSGKGAESGKEAAKDGSKDAVAAKSDTASTASAAKGEGKAPTSASEKPVKSDKGASKKASRAAAK